MRKLISATTELGLPESLTSYILLPVSREQTSCDYSMKIIVSWSIRLDHSELQGLPSFGIGGSKIQVGNSVLLE